MKTSTLIRSLLGGIFGLALVIGLLYLDGMPPKQFATLLLRIRPGPFAGIVLCSLLYVILGAMKWHLISGVKAPRRFFYTYYTAQAMLIGQFLPPPVAIAVNRAAVMKFKQKATLKKGFLNALYDMGFDFLAAALLVPVSILQLLNRFSFGVWIYLSLVVLVVATCALMHAPKILPAHWRKRFELPKNKRGLLSQRIIGLMMLLSSLRLGIVIVRLALGAAAFGIVVPFATVAYVVPPSTMSALLVLTPANLGIAEWSWTYLLTLWGIPIAAAAFYSVSFRILIFLAQLIVSAMCWALYKIGNRR